MALPTAAPSALIARDFPAHRRARIASGCSEVEHVLAASGLSSDGVSHWHRLPHHRHGLGQRESDDGQMAFRHTFLA